MIFEPGHIMQIISMLPKMSTFMSSENNLESKRQQHGPYFLLQCLYLNSWPAQLIDILSKWHFECTYLTKHSALKQGTSEPFVEERITRWTECSCCNSMKRSFVCSSILSERPHSPLSLFNIPSLLLTDDMILSMINTYCQFILGYFLINGVRRSPDRIKV